MKKLQDQKELASNLKNVRESLGLSIYKVSKDLSFNFNTIKDIEEGKKQFTYSKAKTYNNYLVSILNSKKIL